MNYKQYREMCSKEIADLIFRQKGYRAWWDYVTALRGPDFDDMHMPSISFSNPTYIAKELLTCFLRGSSETGPLGIYDFERLIGNLYNSPNTKYPDEVLEKYDINKNKEIIYLVCDNSNNEFFHFLHHICLGLKALESVVEHHELMSLIINSLMEIVGFDNVKLDCGRIKRIPKNKYICVYRQEINFIHSIINKEK